MRRALAAALAAAAVAMAALGTAAAGALPADPHANIPLGRLPAACFRAPRGSVCEHASMRALDRARARTGLPAYTLPPGFLALSAPRQWLILSNLDRVAFGLRPIGGLVLPLDRVARQGALAHADPNPWSLLRTLPGQTTIGFASNWAGGQENGLLAYYGWMYDDGPGGPNIDCPSASAQGCWGHRHDILAFDAARVVVMGAAAVGRSYAMTVVELSRRPWPLSYAWASVELPAALKYPPR